MADNGLHGSLVSVSERTLGDQLAVAASSGATTLFLNDVSYFDEDGGYAVVGSNIYAYDTADMVADSIHLTSGLVASAAVGDVVSLWDSDEGVVVSERIALVALEDSDGDPINAVLDHSLTPLLATTTMAAGQSVSMRHDGAGYRLAEVHGKNNQALQRSTSSGLQVGVDMNDGTTAGLQITPGGTVVRLATNGDARVKTTDGTTFLPMLASAFTVSSDAALKTPPTKGPDALAIIAAAPAKHWRYKSDPKRVKRVGPMADDLPEWLQQVDPEDGTLGIDLARQSGLHHRAIEQLLARIEALETELDKLKGKR